MKAHNAHVITRVTIGAAPAAVFHYLINLKRHYLWNPQIQTISTDGMLKLGSVYQTTSQVLGVRIASHNIVTKFSPPKELAIENNTGTVHYQAHFKLRRKGDGTEVVLATTVSADSAAFAFTVPILKRLAHRELQTDMQALKVAVENGLE